MKKITFFVSLLLNCSVFAQVFTFSSTLEGKTITHRIMVDEQYFVETQYVENPPEFILTRGGFYTKENETYSIALEFNSNFENDALKDLTLQSTSNWSLISNAPIDLNGKWLMAGRVTNEGEQRRAVSGPRKTMKFLKDGYFQWIAFNTETLQFFGSGGGYYTTEDGQYTEHIQFFSRNNTTVGRVLPFQYKLKERDWFHSGKSSKGDSMHEIWTKRMDNPLQ